MTSGMCLCRTESSSWFNSYHHQLAGLGENECLAEMFNIFDIISLNTYTIPYNSYDHHSSLENKFQYWTQKLTYLTLFCKEQSREGNLAVGSIRDEADLNSS